MKHKLVILALISALFFLTNCDPVVKKYLGIERKSPDEYSVIKASPLSIPPNFDLNVPGEAAKQSADQVNKNNSDEQLTSNDRLFLRKTQKAMSSKNVKNH